MVIVREEDGKEEMLWIKLGNGKVKARIGIVYMPQENEVKVDDLKNIYKKIEEEIEKARMNKEKLFLMGDFNCKIGTESQGNTLEISKGGRILLAMCKKQELSIVNKDVCCDGKWTRIDKNGQKSILEYMITTKEDALGNTIMTIDEDK